MLGYAGLAIAVMVAAILIAVGWQYWRFDRAIRAEVERVAAASGEAVVVSEAMLAGLPEPAQRFLRHSGVVGRPIPQVIRTRQQGRIRSAANSGWMNFEAEQIYSTNPPAFVWRVSMPRRSMALAIGRDAYLDGRGSILIKLLGVVPVAAEDGPELREAALLRYLNETMWFPAALLLPGIAIAAIDDGSFRATIRDGSAIASGVFFIDPQGRATNFRAHRFDTGARQVNDWETPIAAYKSFAIGELPAGGAAVWKRSDGAFSYIELEITDVRHQ